MDFEIRNTSDVDMVYTKVVVLNKSITCSQNVFDLKSYRVLDMCLKFIDFVIQNLEFLKDLECSHS
jgi:hypothetical protein